MNFRNVWRNMLREIGPYREDASSCPSSGTLLSGVLETIDRNDCDASLRSFGGILREAECMRLDHRSEALVQVPSAAVVCLVTRYWGGRRKAGLSTTDHSKGIVLVDLL